ncbi:hypothetical protein J1N35_020583 [Gossypium stocksii]|uniref:Glycosyltransferase family 92 protein n=1 Tax=Gossypium stocksii TaxID=47602 RepID=A0A9D3VE36_9ROSI|nr:hypothetical protein J1N35_020583 [Gossypium stocksii]
MENAIFMARDTGMDWIIHLDTDELIYPNYVSGIIFISKKRNLEFLVIIVYTFIHLESSPESIVERDDIKDPFGEVTMFKKNYDHLPKETYFGLYREATRGNANYFLTYENGKKAAHVQDELRLIQMVLIDGTII